MRRAYVALLPLHLSPAVTLLLFELVAAPSMLACGWLYFRAVEARFIGSAQVFRRSGVQAFRTDKINGKLVRVDPERLTA